MSRLIEIDYTGEGRVDALVARRLILEAGHMPGRDFVSNRRHKGKDALDLSLAGLNAGARFGRFILALRDLDHDAPCAGMLLTELDGRHLAQRREVGLLIRVAVRSIEAWLLADAHGFSRASGVPRPKIPSEPERLANPKDTLVGLLCHYGNQNTRAALLLRRPGERPTNQVLGAWTASFATDGWDVESAVDSGRAPSLSRCLFRLRGLGLDRVPSA